MARLKDVNGDGKRNFKDTWLGEKLLGGGKTKGPNLKESMAGARRESALAPKSSPVPKAKPSASTPKVKPTQTKKAADIGALSGASRSVAGKVVKEKKVAAFKQPNRPITSEKLAGPFTKANVAAMGDYTEKEYNLLPTQARVARGLPRSLGAYAIPPGTFKTLKQTKRPYRPTENTVNVGGQYATVGYAKGGTVKKKKAC